MSEVKERENKNNPKEEVKMSAGTHRASLASRLALNRKGYCAPPCSPLLQPLLLAFGGRVGRPRMVITTRHRPVPQTKNCPLLAMGTPQREEENTGK